MVNKQPKEIRELREMALDLAERLKRFEESLVSKVDTTLIKPTEERPEWCKGCLFDDMPKEFCAGRNCSIFEKWQNV